MTFQEWIRAHVDPTAEPELVHERPWASVWRVPTGGGVVWFKACAPVQAFEPRLTADLAARHPQLMPDVIAADVDRGWLLLGDLGAPFGFEAMTLDAYVEVLPRYAELQLAEAAHVDAHLANGVADLRPAQLPLRFPALLEVALPLEPYEVDRLRAFEPRFAELCAELDAAGVPPTIQHDDLHGNNLYPHPGGARILDWGDSSVAHPFFSFVQAFRHSPTEWHAAMRAAYLEPWGDAAAGADLAISLSWFAYAIALVRDGLFGSEFASVLRTAIAQIETVPGTEAPGTGTR